MPPATKTGRLRSDLEFADRNIAEVRALADRLQAENAELRRQVAGSHACTYQARIAEWMLTCFGADITNSRQERSYRFSEEAGEWCQAQGMTLDQWIDIGRYVWGRPVGDPLQEAGGVMVTFAAACTAAGIDMADAGETELARIDTPKVIDKIRRKHAAKVLRTAHDALPGDAP